MFCACTFQDFYYVHIQFHLKIQIALYYLNAFKINQSSQSLYLICVYINRVDAGYPESYWSEPLLILTGTLKYQTLQKKKFCFNLMIIGGCE